MNRKKKQIFDTVLILLAVAAAYALGILPDSAILGGTMTFDGEPLTAERKARLRGGDIALVPQSVA